MLDINDKNNNLFNENSNNTRGDIKNNNNKNSNTRKNTYFADRILAAFFP